MTDTAARAALETVSCALCGVDDTQPARLLVPRDEAARSLGLEGGRSVWVVCRRCGLVYQNPRPGPDAVTAMYAEGGYHQQRGGVPEHYVEYSLRRSRAALAWGLAAAGLERMPGDALDVGCGIGGALVALRERGWAVRGVEPDPNLAAVARDRFGLDVLTSVLEPDTYPAGTEFDLAYTCHVWEHLADPITVTSEAHRMLAPRGGHLLVVVPTYERARNMAWGCFSTPHTYMYGEATLRALLERCGFEVVAGRHHAGADTELWMLARAVLTPPRPSGGDDIRRVQRRIAMVPVVAPLGIPGRLAVHARTLAGDPADFARRLGRWARMRAGVVREQLRP